MKCTSEHFVKKLFYTRLVCSSHDRKNKDVRKIYYRFLFNESYIFISNH